MTNSTQTPNRLINEISPYLLQHAYNPVDWYPWGEEAFAKAKSEDKPIFLSIGYSTCHWCHVMEAESFESRDTADFLNKHFVCIKVDREERPDIDSIYMNICQFMTESGGWPLSIFMTPEQKPFYTGTYFPPHSKYGHIGFMELLMIIEEAWRLSRDDLCRTGDKITSDAASIYANRVVGNSEQEEWDKIAQKAYLYFSASFDNQYGGFGREPKFPSPHNLMFLTEYSIAAKEPSALQMAEKTIMSMYKGGIFDHIGYGFSRYSTDRIWLAPHFEKMLYDNALMVITISDIYKVTKKPVYKSIAEKILIYIKREMTSDEGGFYSAQDADSEGEEGKFYTFSYEEIIDVLGLEDGEKFCKFFGMSKGGNFEGKNIPNLINNRSRTEEELSAFDSMIKNLYEYRSKRYLLHKDDKILTSWNAMMIIAYARAYSAFGAQEYLTAAEKALSFIQTNLTDEDGGFLISYRNRKAAQKGLLDDYAYMTWSYLELYDATFDINYIIDCINCIDKITDKFFDRTGGYFLNPKDGEQLILRPKEQYDGAVPSGNSVLAYCFNRLYSITGEDRFKILSDSQLSFYYPSFREHPYAYSFALRALLKELYPSGRVICIVKEQDDVQNLRREFEKYFLPQLSFIVKTPENEKKINELIPMLKNYKFDSEHKYVFYMCRGSTCKKPVYNFEDLIKSLDRSI